MDDVDAVQAQIARNMLDSGDWVTARLDGVKYLEKSPLKYWMIAVSYMIFGVHDWAARIPLALSTILLCWVVFRFGRWAFSPQAGLWAGIVLATCAGLFLFTRILIPDVVLTLTITLAMWSFLRVLDDGEARPRLWAAVLAASIATGLLLKGLIAAVFPVGSALIYLAVNRRLFDRATWKRLRPVSGLLIVLAIAAPWHILATLRNPPYFDFTMKSGPGHYRGFFWFYFFNEHVFRFLNMRYPRDYNTVPRVYFWLFHLLWLFPWSLFLGSLVKLSFRPKDRAGRTRQMALIWVAFVLIFFTFSTTQEYYSMPCYPALAILLGCAIASGPGVRAGLRLAGTIAALAAVACGAIWFNVRNLPSPGDISTALTQHPEAYTLSLGHMGDLTLASFAYLRAPLLLAALAFTVGAAGSWLLRGSKALFSLAIMMVLFVHSARLAMVVFDPYLSSRPLAEALLRSPKGTLIVDDQYYTFSSVFFYANTRALLLNGRVNNLEYGSNAPDAPRVFLADGQFPALWNSTARYYLLVEKPSLGRIAGLVGRQALHVVAESGGKYLLVNHT
ncbi:MAG: glycosyltransferase family 39 protein [Bryobacterales bacterium]|nr:glycosyltransferase family 39 protein [Bryobacterales bacterium]